MTSYLVVVNPASGRGRALARAEALRSALAGLDTVEVVHTRGRGDASEAVARRGPDFERIIAVGGDGTLNEVLGGLMSIGGPASALPALGFLASGTANAAVPALGFGTDPSAVGAALRDVEARPVDVGIAAHAGTERPFLLWFGAGYDAVVIDALNTGRTGLMGIAGIVRRMPGVLRAVHRYPAPHIRVSADAGPPSTAASVILANVAEMAFGGTVTKRADPFDGQLDLVTIATGGTARVAALTLQMLISALDRGGGVRHGQTARVRLEADGHVPFQLDGEPVGALPVEIRIAPGAVRLLVT